MRSLVLRHLDQEIQAQKKTEAGIKMALKCEFCGKAPHYGNVISHANNTRRRRWNPNLKRVRAVCGGREEASPRLHGLHPPRPRNESRLSLQP